MTDTLKFLRSKEAHYTPATETTDHLRAIVMAPIIGPVAVGKSTLMDCIKALCPDEFGRVMSFTTRPIRTSEAITEYRFLPHTEATLEALLKSIENGQLVQYAVHPTTGFIYGSDISDYPKKYMMLDTLSGAVDGLRKLPFKRMAEIILVTTPEEWSVRFAWRQRLQANSPEPDDGPKRIREGILSLQWSLDQGDAVSWLTNNAGEQEITALRAVDIIKNGRASNVHARRVGAKLLKSMSSLVS